MPHAYSRPSAFIKIYGSMRSGTNLTEWLLRNNFPKVRILVDEIGWKHGCVPDRVDFRGSDWADPSWEPDQRRRFSERRIERLRDCWEALQDAVNQGQVGYIFVSKNPYAWYASFTRYQHLQCCPVRGDLIDHWVQMNQHWLAFQDTSASLTFRTTHESLLFEPEQVLQAISDIFNLPMPETLRPHCQWALSDDAAKETEHTFDRHYYAHRGYLSLYSPDDLGVFERHLCPQLMRRLGYEVIHHSAQVQSR